MTLSKKSIVIGLYLLSLHILTGFLLSKTYMYQALLELIGLNQEIHTQSDTYRSILTHQLRRDGNTKADTFVFFGDSMVQGLNTSAIVNPSENYGIGFDTTKSLLDRLPHYRSSQLAQKVFIGIGINDIGTIAPNDIVDNIQSISQLIPSKHHIFVSGILPVAPPFDEGNIQEQINKSNFLLEETLNKHANIFYIPPAENLFNQSGSLKNELHIGDGLHLNSSGYAIWIEHLKHRLNTRL